MLLLLPLLAGACGAQGGLNQADGPKPANGAEPAAGGGAPPPVVQTTTLTGLYEGGTGQPRSQLCVVERAGGEGRFGMVVHGAGGQSCAGSGAAVRQGPAVRLSMQGDEACTVTAQLQGTRLVLPAQLPAGCNYYCSRGATLAGAAFDKTGGTAEDAMRATDLVGDRLCAGTG